MKFHVILFFSFWDAAYWDVIGNSKKHEDFV